MASSILAAREGLYGAGLALGLKELWVFASPLSHLFIEAGEERAHGVLLLLVPVPPSKLDLAHVAVDVAL